MRCGPRPKPRNSWIDAGRSSDALLTCQMRWGMSSCSGWPGRNIPPQSPQGAAQQSGAEHAGRQWDAAVLSCRYVTRRAGGFLAVASRCGEGLIFRSCSSAGISNWELDAAKMNRAIHLVRLLSARLGGLLTPATPATPATLTTPHPRLGALCPSVICLSRCA